MARTIEELAQIQKEHEELMEAERQKKEAEEKAERERLAKALEKLNRCHSMKRDLNIAQKELDAIEETNIQERIGISEETKGTLAEREELFKSMQGDLSGIDERIAGISQLVKGKKYVAPEINEELETAQKEHKALKQKITELAQKIEELKEKIVSEGEIKKYQDMVEKVYLLNSEIREIENDPDVGKLYAEEISRKSDMVKMIVDSAVNKLTLDEKKIIPGIENKDYLELRKDFAKKITEQFIKDEIESRQIDAIKDRSMRLEAYKKVGKFLTLGLNTSDSKSLKFGKDNSKAEISLAYAGLALANLIGKNNSGGVLNSIANEIREEEKSPKIKESHIQDAIKIHYKTLNIISAYIKEIGKNKFADIIMSHAKNFDVLKIKDKFNDISVNKDGFIIPKSATSADKSETNKLFQNCQNYASELKEKIDNILFSKKQEELEKINTKLTALKNYLKDIELQEKELKEIKISDLEKEEEKIKEIISNKEERLNTARVEYENTLLLNITRRGEISKEIKDLENFLVELNDTLESINSRKNNWQKIKENLKKLKEEYGSPEELKKKIADIEEIIKSFPN